MSTLKRLFDQRSQLGRVRQPEHHAILDGLDARLPPGRNPFDGSDEVRAVVATFPSFRTGPTGKPGKLGPSTKYLYRVSSTSAIVEYSNWNSGRRPANHKIAHRQMMTASDEGEKWIPLSTFADGELSSFRRATFWTPAALRRRFIARDVGRVGVPSDFILKRSVILRLDIQRLQGLGLKVFVPTVLDAYTYPVFHPQRTTEAPERGMAIDVGKIPLDKGYEEVVVPPVPASLVSIRPLLIGKNEKRAAGIYELLDLLVPLEHYYTTLEED